MDPMRLTIGIVEECADRQSLSLQEQKVVRSAQATTMRLMGIPGWLDQWYITEISPTQQQESHRRYCNLFREIFGNPFRPVPIDPSWLAWRGGLVVMLAQSIYDERRFQDLPILADALEEAGCTSEDLLAHCRSSGEHVRGCWAVDLVLGKE
jgi:hypothetical protein